MIVQKIITKKIGKIHKKKNLCKKKTNLQMQVTGINNVI